jgi:hypothetical protein
VIDLNVLSNYCKTCKMMSGKDENSDDYKAYIHKSLCTFGWRHMFLFVKIKIFDRSSNAMEATGDVVLWKKSIDTISSTSSNNNILCDKLIVINCFTTGTPPCRRW